MSILDTLTDTLSVNNFVLIVGLIVILLMVSLVALNNSNIRKTFANITVIALFTLLFSAVLIYPPFMKAKFVGQPDYACEVFERDENDNIIFEFVPTLDKNGEPALDVNGNPIIQQFPLLKKYYFPLQDVDLIRGVLNIRLQTADKNSQTIERYCAFDIFPKAPEGSGQEQSAEQVAMKKWYNSLKSAKEALDKANAIKNLSEMTPAEMESIAKGLSEDANGLKQTVKADNNLNRFKAELGKQMAQRQAEKQSAGSQQSQGQKGIKPSKGLTITLPAKGQERPSENSHGETSNGGNPSWETSNGPNPSGESQRDPLPSKTR